MDLEIHQRDREGIRIVDLRGGLTIGESEAKLRDTILELVKTGVLKIILNFAEVQEIDDDGLGALVLCSAKVRKSGGALQLLNLSPTHIQLFVLVRLDLAFDVFTDEVDAVNSFFPERIVPRFDLLEFVNKTKSPSSEP